MLMKVFDCRENLPHQRGSLLLAELMHFNYLLKELSALCELHYDVNVTIVDIGLMELYNIWMVYLGQDGELFLEKLHVLFYVFLQYALYSVLNLWVGDPVSDSDGPEMAAPDKFLEGIHGPDVRGGEGLRYLLKRFYPSRRVMLLSRSHSLCLPMMLLLLMISSGAAAVLHGDVTRPLSILLLVMMTF